MTTLKLPNVTLVCLTGRSGEFDIHKKALDKSQEDIEFGGVKFILDETIKNIDDWNYKIIYELPNYIDTDFALLIHPDGYVIDRGIWDSDWLSYDYVGAPWPLPRDGYSYRSPLGTIVRVGNSVSLRSKKLMDLMTKTPKDYFWSMKEKYGNTNEDGYICCHNKEYLEASGCTFAPLEVAVYFSKEHEIPENKGLSTFAFHSL